MVNMDGWFNDWMLIDVNGWLIWLMDVNGWFIRQNCGGLMMVDSGQNPGWLMIKGDYITLYIGDYNNQWDIGGICKYRGFRQWGYLQNG